MFDVKDVPDNVLALILAYLDKGATIEPDLTDPVETVAYCELLALRSCVAATISRRTSNTGKPIKRGARK